MTDKIETNTKINAVQSVLRDLLKVIKVVALYPEDNPLPQSLKQSFAERLIDTIDDFGDLYISVEKDALKVDGEIVFQDKSKEERLAGVFHDSGIVDLTIHRDIAGDDVYSFLTCMKDFLNAPGHDRDLCVQLWNLNRSAFTFNTVEDMHMQAVDGSLPMQEFVDIKSFSSRRIQQFGYEEEQAYSSIFVESLEAEVVEQASLSDSGSQAMAATPGAILLNVSDEEASQLHVGEASAAMGYDDLPAAAVDPDASLIIRNELELSAAEETSIQEILFDDAAFEMFESTAALLKELLLQEVDMSGFYETVTICEKVMTEFIQAGQLYCAADVLRFLKKLESKISSDRPLWAERLKEAGVTAGSRDRLKVLSNALNEHPDVSPGEVTRYLECLGLEALSGITELMGEFEHIRHRNALSDFLTERGKGSIEIISRGIFDKRWDVVINAVKVLVRIGDNKSLDVLKHVLHHDERRVRYQLVVGLKECDNPEALALLQVIAADKDPEIRHEAILGILRHHSEPAFGAISEVINNDAFSGLESTDREELLIAFSRLGGDHAVGYLEQLIRRKSLVPSQSVTFYRYAAFEALTHNKSEKAERLLVKLAASWSPAIRRLATEALRRRRAVIYGETK